MDKAASRIRLPKKPLLHCKSSLNGGQNAPFEFKWRLFSFIFLAHSRSLSLQSFVYKQYNTCTRKTREFRAKDFFVHSTRSFEQLEMQI